MVKLNLGVRFARPSCVMLNVTGKGVGILLFFLGIDKLSGVLKGLCG